MEENNCNSGSMLASFLLGGILGAGIAILLAPKSGHETIEKIKEVAGTVKGKIASSVDSAKDIYEEKKSAVSVAVEAGKEAYKKEIDTSKQKA
ncbi:MAG: YtxH domain-containing protein [Desulfobacterium sp.]|nr:YtxH domain-containing protein [Desulfobacterium sp.]MBU3947783.1 YtxH domain-containing protein [Pseudomonadota bacterium]MBU4010598.1 YtxH domain-containing protein [Pseudomonadota bacterium]MBU4036180.1 YtxH domain-containing protein [Pseudomonadota bacterium]